MQSLTINPLLAVVPWINFLQEPITHQKLILPKEDMRQAGRYSGLLLSGGLSARTGPHSLPLARIKKIMKKSGDDVKMISGEAPIVFSKACELFIEELTTRSWMVTMQGKRRTLHKEDVASAVIATDIFDFLVNLVANNSSNSKDNTEEIGSWLDHAPYIFLLKQISSSFWLFLHYQNKLATIVFWYSTIY